MEKRPELYRELSSCAKRKRTYDKSNPAYKWAALFITLMGIAALVYGIYALVTKAGFGIYFLLFGLAAIFSSPVRMFFLLPAITGGMWKTG